MQYVIQFFPSFPNLFSCNSVPNILVRLTQKQRQSVGTSFCHVLINTWSEFSVMPEGYAYVVHPCPCLTPPVSSPINPPLLFSISNPLLSVVCFFNLDIHRKLLFSLGDAKSVESQTRCILAKCGIAYDDRFPTRVLRSLSKFHSLGQYLKGSSGGASRATSRPSSFQSTCASVDKSESLEQCVPCVMGVKGMTGASDDGCD